MNILIRHGADVNAINKWNQSPLEMSMGKTIADNTDVNRVAAQRLLLRHGGLTGSDYQKKYWSTSKAGVGKEGHYNIHRSSFHE